MLSIRIEQYEESQKAIWDAFIEESKNGTFLFLRGYMDYHRDRFDDHSLLIWIDEALFAVLPANRSNNDLVSHGGLTYGGLVLRSDAQLSKVVELFPVLLEYLKAREISSLTYKTIPHIYHKAPAEEDRYCLFRHRAVRYRSDVLTVVDLRNRPEYQERRARSVKRATKSGLVVRETDDYEGFWNILAANLRDRYDVRPVHSLEEILLLAGSFPAQIRLHAAYEGDTIRAGAVLYRSSRVCHVQYNAASIEGKKLGAQDLLFDDLIARYSSTHQYFDFGVSTEREGQDLNPGLIDYKEGFGGRCVVHDFFRLDLNT
jgi:hypothetical protein